MRWIAGGPLYPPRGSWIVNNYPPLWFMLEGGLGAWLGDPILAGRIVALAAFALAALLIAAAVRALGGDRLASVELVALGELGARFGHVARAEEILGRAKQRFRERTIGNGRIGAHGRPCREKGSN